MELGGLQKFVLMIVLVGLILGVGILTLDLLGTAVKNTAPVVNETVAFTNYAGSVANDEVQGVTGFTNASNGTSISLLLTTDVINWTSGGAFTVNQDLANGTYNITYTFLEDSASTDSVVDSRNAIATISSTWLSLIITIVILAIIIVIVIRSFGQGVR